MAAGTAYNCNKSKYYNAYQNCRNRQPEIELTEREAMVGSSSLIHLTDSDIEDTGVGIF